MSVAADGPRLLDTLRAFLSHDCSWSRTAEALHI
ncbi:helix-turn-helix domain-containing protein [Streptomyces sp. 2131.1]|nr:helix-turn-helix domain-containing protein [Streptomyces sp. 2131.1]